MPPSLFGQMWRERYIMYEDWATKAEVRARTGISERTLERMIQDKKVRREYRRIPGRKPLSIIHPEDVQELEVKTAKLVPAETQVAPKLPQRDMAELVAALLLPRTQPDKKLYLTLKEAAEFSGLPISYLKRQIKTQGLPAVKIGSWRIRREDLESHRVNAASGGIV